MKDDIHFIFNPIQQEEINLIKEVNRILIENPVTQEEIILRRFTRACFYQNKKKLIDKLRKEKGFEVLPKEKETIVIKLEQPEIKEIRMSPIPISTAPPPKINISQSFAQMEPTKINPFQNEQRIKEQVKLEPVKVSDEESQGSFSGFQESSFEHHQEIPITKKEELKAPSPPPVIEEPPSPPSMEKFTDLVMDEEGKSIVKVRLVKDNFSGDLFYEVKEPLIDRNLFSFAINKNLKPDDKDFNEYVEKYCKKLNLEFNPNVADALRYHLFKYNSPFGPIDPLIHDSDIISISSTITSPLIIKYKTGETMKSNIKIENADYSDLIRNFGVLIGRKLSIKEPSAEGVYQNFKFTLNIGGIVKPSFTIERLDQN